jgi:presenilin-like A22 family membrane protease
MNKQKRITPTFILFLQILSISLIWLLVVSVIFWILNLISLSSYLHDAQNATLGISIVVMPVFILLAAVLTYVFVGLRKARFKD